MSGSHRSGKRQRLAARDSGPFLAPKPDPARRRRRARARTTTGRPTYEIEITPTRAEREERRKRDPFMEKMIDPAIKVILNTKKAEKPIYDHLREALYAREDFRTAIYEALQGKEHGHPIKVKKNIKEARKQALILVTELRKVASLSIILAKPYMEMRDRLS